MFCIGNHIWWLNPNDILACIRCRWPCFGKGLDEMNPRGPFQPQPACNSVKWQWRILSGFFTNPLLTQFNFLRNILQAYLTLPENISLITVLLLYSSVGNQLSFTSKSHIQDEFFHSINTGVNRSRTRNIKISAWVMLPHKCKEISHVTPCF